jgi:cell division septation protein DedD
MMSFISTWADKLGVKIVCSQETEPMGTAGPLALARSLLDDGSGSPFFVLNSDVVCLYPLKDMLDFHVARKAEATLLVTKVEDPSKYGVVVIDEATGLVERFVEKPKEFVGDKINAGIYVLSTKVRFILVVLMMKRGLLRGLWGCVLGGAGGLLVLVGREGERAPRTRRRARSPLSPANFSLTPNKTPPQQQTPNPPNPQTTKNHKQHSRSSTASSSNPRRSSARSSRTSPPTTRCTPSPSPATGWTWASPRTTSRA